MMNKQTTLIDLQKKKRQTENELRAIEHKIFDLKQEINWKKLHDEYGILKYARLISLSEIHRIEPGTEFFLRYVFMYEGIFDFDITPVNRSLIVAGFGIDEIVDMHNAYLSTKDNVTS